MAVTHLKNGISAAAEAASDCVVRDTVAAMLADIAQHRDAAVRRYSEQYDRWSPSAFRLSESEIAAFVAELPDHVRDDLEFAQAQIRGFARIQLASIHDVEVETLPGVILGQRSGGLDESHAPIWSSILFPPTVL